MEAGLFISAGGNAVPVLKYSHPAYERYAAAAKNQYGNGSTLYFGTMFENDELLESVLLSFLHETGFSGGDLSSDAPHYPLIVKRGINDSGKELCYYLNYSKDPVSVTHRGKDGIELVSETSIVCGDKIDLGGWGVAVVEM